MPNAQNGFSGSEIVEHIKRWYGNQSSDFQTLVEEILPMAEFRFCSMHDWNFLLKQNLSLTVVSNTQEYTLDSSSIGFAMSANDVKSIFSSDNGIYLKKLTLDQFRRLDPESDDGSSSSKLQYWCPAGENKILVYPKQFADTTLKIDGKITPSALLTLSNYPTIPFIYQESFIKYAIASVATRENDDRAANLMQEATALIRSDIARDLTSQGDTTSPRIKSMNEQGYDGAVGTADPLNMFED